MRFHLRPRSPGLLLALTIAVGLLAPRSSSADVITIDDGALPGTATIPFTCSVGTDVPLWLPYMGFVYRNVEAFELSPGDTIAFDIQMQTGQPDDLGFFPQVDLALAHAPIPAIPFRPADVPGSDFTVVAENAVASSKGNRIAGDYDLVFTVTAPFRFPGGGLIIRVSDPMGVLAARTDLQCLSSIISDRQPSGTNRLVGTFKLEDGEYPWVQENTTSVPSVPYVRIAWTRCGDGRSPAPRSAMTANTTPPTKCRTAAWPRLRERFHQPWWKMRKTPEPKQPKSFGKTRDAGPPSQRVRLQGRRRILPGLALGLIKPNSQGAPLRGALGRPRRHPGNNLRS